MKNFSKITTLRVLGDCFITVGLLIINFNFLKFFGPPVKRGFFCDDESLKYPYHRDTVNGTVLHALTLYLPSIVMIVGDSLLYLIVRRHTTNAQDHGYVTALLRLHHNITPFLCGFALHGCLVQTTKITLGRLRPHFFEVCQPYRQSDLSTCHDPRNHGLYIEDYECNINNRPYMHTFMLYNLHLSFPSAHASYIFYAMTYILLYLQRFSKSLSKFKINVGLLMLVIQMQCVLLASFVAMSRVMDYKHHWSDVLVGIVLGTAAAIAVTQYVCQQLNSVNSSPEGVKSSNTETTSTTTFATTMPDNVLVP